MNVPFIRGAFLYDGLLVCMTIERWSLNDRDIDTKGGIVRSLSVSNVSLLVSSAVADRVSNVPPFSAAVLSRSLSASISASYVKSS